MANEATIVNSLHIIKGNLDYLTRPHQFQADVSGTKGPVPGAIEAPATTDGVAIDLSELTTPGLCRIRNLDSTNYVEIGLYISTTFYAIDQIKAGEHYIRRFSPNLNTSYLRVRANTAAVQVSVETFEA